MEAEAIKTPLYLLLLLGGGFMVGVLAIIYFISIATFGAWLAILISSLRAAGRTYADLRKISRDHGRKVERRH